MATDDLKPEAAVDGLLLTRDLMFTSRVTSTAAALGFRIQVVGSIAELPDQVATARPRAVFLDLTCAEFEPAAVVRQLNIDPRPRVIAFGPHVDVQLLQQARDAGCDDVLPRSRFSATLPDLLRQVFETA